MVGTAAAAETVTTVQRILPHTMARIHYTISSVKTE
jgi:hypothetical protein